MANAIKYEDYEMSMEAAKAYLSYTRTKIAELTERITVLEEELEKAIEKDAPFVTFATYSSDDESLNFYGVEDDIPEVGSKYYGKTVDDIYIDFLDKQFSASSSDTTLWMKHKSTIKKVTSTGYIQPTYMVGWFAYFSALESIDLKAFDTSLNKNLKCTFTYCTSLVELDLCGFSVINVMSGGHAFYGDTELTTIYATDGTNWSDREQSLIQQNSTGNDWMFYDCKKLKSPVRSYSSGNSSYEMANTATGYFTAK